MHKLVGSVRTQWFLSCSSCRQASITRRQMIRPLKPSKLDRRDRRHVSPSSCCSQCRGLGGRRGDSALACRVSTWLQEYHDPDGTWRKVWTTSGRATLNGHFFMSTPVYQFGKIYNWNIICHSGVRTCKFVYMCSVCLLQLLWFLTHSEHFSSPFLRFSEFIENLWLHLLKSHRFPVQN